MNNQKIVSYSYLKKRNNIFALKGIEDDSSMKEYLLILIAKLVQILTHGLDNRQKVFSPVVFNMKLGQKQNPLK